MTASRPDADEAESNRARHRATLLSILVPTIPGREAKLARLLARLDPQVAQRDDAELLVLRDSRRLSIGQKRTTMVAIAAGEYVAFVDDDDDVAPNYVASICDALVRDRPDVLCFTVAVQGHGPERPCRYHPSFRRENLQHEYRRLPNHLMAWRRTLAAAVPFPDLRYGEDRAWAERMARSAQTVTTLDAVLYTYRFDRGDNSRTRAVKS